MRTRIPVAIVVSALLFGVMPAGALAQEGSTAAAGVTPTASQSLAFMEQGNIATGAWGTCAWEISDAGVLTIHPGTGGIIGGAGWFPYRDDVTSIKAVAEDGNKIVCPSDSSSLFEFFSNATTADLSGLDTSNVADMSEMFNGCNALKSVNLTGWDTSNVINMYSMFSYCNSLTSLNLAHFNTKKTKNMSLMFTGCTSLKTLDISGWTTTSFLANDYMFFDCTKLGKFVVGANYEMINDHSCPAATSVTGMWWSVKKKVWVTTSEICSKRSGVADTYLASGSDVGKLDLANSAITVTLSQTSFAYTGARRVPEVTVKSGDKVLRLGTHYSWVATKCRSAGTATLTVKGKGMFEGSRTVHYKIVPADIAGASFATVKDKVYTGKAIKPAPDVTFNGKKVVKGTGYKISYKDNTDVGTASIVFKGKGNFTGTKTITFKIRAASIAGGKATVRNATYTGKACKPKVTVSVGKNVLRSKRDYKLVYQNNVDAGTATVVITGIDNYKGTLKAKFKIARASIKKGRIAKISKQSYTGKKVEPVPKLTVNKTVLKAGSDFKCTYSGNISPGTATFEVTGIGNYKDSLKGSFTIAAPKNPLTVTTNKIIVSQYKLNKSAGVFAPIKVSKAVGAVSYIAVSGSSALTLNKANGRVTVKKGTKAGKYSLRVKVTASGGGVFKAVSKTVTVKVSVTSNAVTTEVEPNDEYDEANYLTVGASMSGTLKSSATDDWFRVYLKEGGTYRLYLSNDQVNSAGGTIIGHIYANGTDMYPYEEVSVYLGSKNGAYTQHITLTAGNNYIRVWTASAVKDQPYHIIVSK